LGNTTKLILLENSLGSLNSISKPVCVNLFSGLFLASDNYYLSFVNSYESLIVLDPSSATFYAAPSSSISRSTSVVFSFSECETERPSFLTAAAFSCFIFYSDCFS